MYQPLTARDIHQKSSISLVVIKLKEHTIILDNEIVLRQFPFRKMNTNEGGNIVVDEDIFDDNDDVEISSANKVKSKLYNEGYSDGRLHGVKNLVYQRVKVGFKRGIEVGIICGALYSECNMFHHRFNNVKKDSMDVLLGNIRRILLEEFPNEVDTSKLLPELYLHLHELAMTVEAKENQLLQKYNEFVDKLKLIDEKFGPVVSTHDATSNCCAGTGTCKGV